MLIPVFLLVPRDGLFRSRALSVLLAFVLTPLSVLRSFAVGGAGLIIAEKTSVQPHGRITPNCTGLWKDEQIAAQKRIVDFIHAHGSAAGIQLGTIVLAVCVIGDLCSTGHAGRKASMTPPFLSAKEVRAFALLSFSRMLTRPLPPRQKADGLTMLLVLLLCLGARSTPCRAR